MNDLEKLSARIDGEAAEASDNTALEQQLRLADSHYREVAKAELKRPVPPASVGAVQQAFAARRRRSKRHALLRAALPIAASVAIVTGGAVWLDGRADSRQAETAQLVEAAVQQALETRASGQEVVFPNEAAPRVRVTPVRTYRSTSDHWCREFEERLGSGSDAVVRTGIACRAADGRWKRIETRYSGDAPVGAI